MYVCINTRASFLNVVKQVNLQKAPNKLDNNKKRPAKINGADFAGASDRDIGNRHSFMTHKYVCMYIYVCM